MTDDEIAKSIGLKRFSSNYDDFMDIMNTIHILEKVSNSSKTMKLNEIKVKKLKLDTKWNEHLILDMGFPLTVISQERVLLTVRSEINGKDTTVSSSINGMVNINYDSEDWEDIDISVYKKYVMKAAAHNEITLAKLAKLSMALRNQYKTISFPGDVETTLLEPKPIVSFWDKPELILFDEHFPFSYVEYGEYIAYFDESFNITHIGQKNNNEHLMINLSTDLDLFGELEELIIEKTGISELYDKLSTSLVNFSSMI